MANECLSMDYEYSEEDVVIDPYNCDLNLIIDRECLLAYPQTTDGFCLMWAGAKATYGTSEGRVVFEVHLSDYIECDELTKDDPDNYSIRIGWSLKGASMQLGEDRFSFAYCNNARKCTQSVFEDYGESFEKGDSIAAYFDYETDAKHILIGFCKNGHDMGLAFEVAKSELVASIDASNTDADLLTFYPHILTRNIVYEVNFGARMSVLGDEPFAPIRNGFELIQKLPLDKRFKNAVAPAEKSQCDCVMLVGLPGAGKTQWARQLASQNPQKCYNVLGLATVLDKMKMLGTKKKSDPGNGSASGSSKVDFVDKAAKCMNRLIEITSQLHRNIILDQNNVYASTRRRKMSQFEGFHRKAVVVVPSDDVYKDRLKKVTEGDDARDIPVSTINDMKANFSLPESGAIFDEVLYVELNEEDSRKLIEQYNHEGSNNRMQAILSKRVVRTDEEKRLLALAKGPNPFRTSLPRPSYGYGYGYGKEKYFQSPPPYGMRRGTSGPYQPRPMGRYPTPGAPPRPGQNPFNPYQASPWNPYPAAFPPPQTGAYMPQGYGAWAPATATGGHVTQVPQEPVQNQWTPALPITSKPFMRPPAGQRK